MKKISEKFTLSQETIRLWNELVFAFNEAKQNMNNDTVLDASNALFSFLKSVKNDIHPKSRFHTVINDFISFIPSKMNSQIKSSVSEKEIEAYFNVIKTLIKVFQRNFINPNINIVGKKLNRRIH